MRDVLILRVKIIKDHIDTKDLNLNSIDFNKQYKISDIINGKEKPGFSIQSESRFTRYSKKRHQ